MPYWESNNTLILAEGGYRGTSADPTEIINLIHASGWKLDKVKWKTNSFVANASTENGERAEARGPSQADALAALLTKIYNLNQIRAFAARIAAISTSWLQLTDRMNEIAQDYSKAPYYDVKAALAWQELATDSRRRADEIRRHIQVESTANPAPYTDASKMFEDIRKKRRLLISIANLDHPIWSGEDLVNFRIVHNVMGYAAADAQFGWQGEVQACAAHAQLLSTNAQRALLTEQIGQLAFSFYAGGPQPKITFLKEVEKIIGLDPKTDSWGIHPSQMVMPTMVPDFTRTSGYVSDPNRNWSSENLGIQPLPNNAYQWGGDPLQAYDEGGTVDTAAKVDSGWYNLTTADGEPDWDRMKQAVFNALKVTILSPRKDLKGNAIHYQHLQHVNSDDPLEYQRALETQREQWNQARGYAPGSHKPYFKEQQQFFDYVRQMNPELDPQQAREEAEREWDHLWRDIEEEYENDPKWQEKTSLDIEHQVARDITKRVKQILKPDINDATDVPDQQMSMFGAAKPQEDIFGNESGKYVAWLGSQPKTLAAIYRHIDELTEAALEDIQQHDGSGHHFRSTLLGFGIPGIGPKVASFSWLLLAPTTSQLGTIDTHMMDLLGAEPKDAGARDYYRLERELAARRDASGYGNVPLGAFQWGMWDAKRTGLGTHQDHSAMKTINPVPYDLIDWNAKSGQTDAGYDLKTDPNWQWWRDTEPAAQAVKEDWNQNVAPYYSQNQIPGASPAGVFAKTANEEIDDSLCFLTQIRPKDALDIWKWVNTLDWPEGTEIELPDEYHITIFYSHDGWSDDANHIWLKGSVASNFFVEATDLELFGPNKDTAVIRFDCPDLVRYADKIRDEAVDRGLDVSYPGEFKAHLTIAKKCSDLPVRKSYPFNFRTDSTALAVPLTHTRFSAIQQPMTTPWHYDDQGNLVKGFVGQSLMDHLRETYKLSPEEVWDSQFDELGKE